MGHPVLSAPAASEEVTGAESVSQELQVLLSRMARISVGNDIPSASAVTVAEVCQLQR